METETTGTTGRDNDADSPQTYRLICIYHPGKETGHRIRKRSVLAEVQDKEQKAGHMPEQAVPGDRQPQIPVQTANAGQEEPAGSERIAAGCVEAGNRNGDSL
jgi:hypothetical protein